jgi:hypothetical protein
VRLNGTAENGRRRWNFLLATLPSLRLTDVRISDKLVRDHDRMLTGGFYAEVELGYDAATPAVGRVFVVTAPSFCLEISR